MTIIVVGARGFIGRWLVRELVKRGMVVEILGVDGDVLDPGTFPDVDPDMVINLAAIAPHRSGYTHQDRYEVDVLGTIGLRDKYPEAKMAFTSAIEVLRKPLPKHARGKRRAEMIIKKRENHLIFRLPSVFGPDQGRPTKLIPQLIDAYRNGTDVLIYNNDMREYIYIEDAVGAIADNLAATGIFRVDGFKIRNHELAEMVRAVCKEKTITDLAPDAQYFYECLRRTIWLR